MQKDGIRLRAAELLDMPADMLAGLLHIEMTGTKEVFIENHKGIIELTENEVTINAGKKVVHVLGQRLSVLSMNSDELRLGGEIERVSFEGA